VKRVEPMMIERPRWPAHRNRLSRRTQHGLPLRPQEPRSFRSLARRGSTTPCGCGLWRS
jgi:hypothetical protein